MYELFVHIPDIIVLSGTDDKPVVAPLKIQDIDLKIIVNTFDHHTDK